MIEIEVALPIPVSTPYSYLIDKKVDIGVRVKVPVGSQKLIGVVWNNTPKKNDDLSKDKLKKVIEILDDTPIYSPIMLKIASWLSEYYLNPIGEVLKAMLPSGNVKTTKTLCQLTDKGLKYLHSSEKEFLPLKKIFGKRTEKQAVTIKNNIKKLILKGDLDSDFSYEDLLKKGLISLKKEKILNIRGDQKNSNRRSPRAQILSNKSLVKSQNISPPPFNLTLEQQSVFDEIVHRALIKNDLSKPFLIWGITGSGKTEVYLRLIAETITRHKNQHPNASPIQSLVMVPEISLTPQMTKVFENRFPGKVAVVHSAMTDTKRWQELDRVRKGEAWILIGPRSAVFGSFINLRLIIVDEEHDSSYKQTTGLCYNGRDVAILRAKLEGAYIVLGSATPSIESFNNARLGKYLLLKIQNRVNNAELPKVEIVAEKPVYKTGMLTSQNKGPLDNSDEGVISDEVIQALNDNYRAGKQAMVIVNRRGYSYYLYSVHDQQPLLCNNCSISLTLHNKNSILKCHYCGYQVFTQKILDKNPDKKFIVVGYGNEQAQEVLSKKIPGANISRLDSELASRKDILNQTLLDFKNSKIDILVGTQILAKGHDFPNVTLIVILEADQLIDMPDFRAGERAFQLIVQASGRAGRAESKGKVLIQTLRHSHPIIYSAINQDYLDFAQKELSFRKAFNYPPFTRMISIEFNSKNSVGLNEYCLKMEDWFFKIAGERQELTKQIKVLGPISPIIEVIRGRYRKCVLFSSPYQKSLREIVVLFLLAFQNCPSYIRMKIDVDPQSLF